MKCKLTGIECCGNCGQPTSYAQDVCADARRVLVDLANSPNFVIKPSPGHHGVELRERGRVVASVSGGILKENRS